MRLRAFTWFLAAFQTFFINVVVPAHVRGSVLLPGSPAPASVRWLAPCCAAKAAAEDSKHSPTPSQQAHCAICFFAAHLSLPPVIDYRPAGLELAETLAIAAPERILSQATTALPPCRGPPADSFLV